ncbi:hypothetical protein [Knoellia flava]|uniref:Uncharacterized protein n=1 Tax=Knoellia flava TaxID=913969 RepID=A0A8H9FTV6_9MICO|nr:hypothetical protein [Knoellia flava]GGB81329.1 hypothetical protein GCM10011314_21170 [Knoellia flava]
MNLWQGRKRVTDRARVRNIVDLSGRLADLDLKEAEARRKLGTLEAVASENAQPQGTTVLRKWLADDQQAVKDQRRLIEAIQEEREDLWRVLGQLAASVVPALQVRAALATARATWALVVFTAALIGATIVAALIARN